MCVATCKTIEDMSELSYKVQPDMSDLKRLLTNKEE